MIVSFLLKGRKMMAQITYKLTGGPSGSTRLQFAFLANTCQWKTSHSHMMLPTQAHAALWERCSLPSWYPWNLRIKKKGTGLFLKTDKRRNIILSHLPVNGQLLSTVEKYGYTSMAGIYQNSIKEGLLWLETDIQSYWKTTKLFLYWINSKVSCVSGDKLPGVSLTA